MESEINQPRHVAKVRHVSDDRKAVYIELRNGLTATYTSSSPVDIFVGDVVFINSEGNNVEPAPQELWREEPWVGVVRLLKNDRVVVDVGGKLCILSRTGTLDLQEGNTVEGLDSIGITSILSEKPVRYIDFPVEDSVTAEYFKQQPSVSPSFDDFGGFREIIDRARELIELPLKHHDALMKIRARPIKGVLFTGPSGTGKTMLARIIANNAGAQFYLISGPQVLSKWYGRSEELIRKIFDDAAKQERAIVLFDEIDSLAAQRSDDSHEASRRIVGQLLTSMDGFAPETNVVVIATTNRPQDIDVALRRPGRFDWEIDFPPPSRQDREEILATSARGLSTGEGLPHALIAEKAESWSPAELAAIWSEAALLAVQDGREIILEEDYFGGFERVAAQRSQVATSRRSERREGDQ
jgi:transitional endoplasmic reticulum ATPase